MPKGARLVTGALAVIAGLSLATPAAAGPGNGIRLGGSAGRLHPTLELEARYDSNVFYADPDRSVGDLVLHVRPGFTLRVPGDSTALELRAALDWAEYLGVEGDTGELSKLFGEASLGVGLNRRGAVGLELTDDFRRSTSTEALALGSAVIANSNALAVAIPFRPGGGALVFTVGGDWLLETFEPYLDGTLCDPAVGGAACDSELLADLGYNQLGGRAELRWKFLPRTAAVLEGRYFARLPNEPDLAAENSGFRVATGLAGLLTARIAGTLKGGYTRTFGDLTLASWFANAELEYLASETTSARLGYLHDVGLDPVAGTFASHRVYGDAKVLLASRFTARLAGQLEDRSYEADEVDVGFGTTLVRVEPSIGAEITRWLTATVAYAYTDRTSDLPAGAPQLPAFDYSKHEAWLRLGLIY